MTTAYATPSSDATLHAIRGAFLDFLDDPYYVPEPESVRYIHDGLMVLENGCIKALGDYATVRAEYPDVPVTHQRDRLLVPGFIDTHVHYPQTEMIGAYGEQLLEWLNKYTFPTEAKFKDKNYAHQVAAFFLEELVKNGTTTAVVLAAVFPESVDAFFEEAQRRNLRMVAGKVMMDRHAPDYLTDTAESAYADSRALIERWHKCDRLLYAITPRFAITSTPEQLRAAGKLLEEFPDVYLHTHLSENLKEVAFTLELFPECTDYLNVYESFGLVRDRSIFAHGIQLSDSEFERLSRSGATIAFCPTSNLFLGSGLFNLKKAKSPEAPVQVGLATDVGGGTSLSMLRTASEAYKVTQLRGDRLSAFQTFYMMTLGGARSLLLDDKIGNFQVGKEADLVALDLQSTPILAKRNPVAVPADFQDMADSVFATMILADERAIAATYIAGQLAYERDAKP